MHATRYQYAFAMTPQRLRVKDRCIDALDGIISLGEVAGNHSRFLFDFSPESIVMRVTEDPAPRLLFCFHEENNTVSAPELVRKVISNDIPPQELFIGGKIAETPEILNLNATICVPGVREAAEKCKENIKERLSSS
jgi:CRISPR-associated protein Cst2